MYKDRRTYTDYNGVERTEDFYFNLTEAELIELEMGTTGGLADMIEHIVSAQDANGIIKVFKKVLLAAYCEKSADGKRLVKSEELSTAYSQTAAYNALFMELIVDANKASSFINAIIPNMTDVSAKISKNTNTTSLNVVK